MLIMLARQQIVSALGGTTRQRGERGDDCQQWHIYEHFLEPTYTGFIEVVSITLIDKTRPKYIYFFKPRQVVW